MTLAQQELVAATGAPPRFAKIEVERYHHTSPNRTMSWVLLFGSLPVPIILTSRGPLDAREYGGGNDSAWMSGMWHLFVYPGKFHWA